MYFQSCFVTAGANAISRLNPYLQILIRVVLGVLSPVKLTGLLGSVKLRLVATCIQVQGPGIGLIGLQMLHLHWQVFKRLQLGLVGDWM
jgi:hypothetical protein